MVASVDGSNGMASFPEKLDQPVRARQVQQRGRNGLAVMLEEILGLVAEEGDDVVDHGESGALSRVSERGLIVESLDNKS